MSHVDGRFGPPLILYLASAAAGLLTSTDGAAALHRFGLITAGLVLFLVLSSMPSRVDWFGRRIPIVRIVVGLLPAVVAVCFLVTNDWTQPVAKLAWLDPLRRLLGGFQPATGFPPLHPNMVGGVLAMLLPLQVAACVARTGSGPSKAANLAAAFGIGLSMVGLLLTGLRGAWLALAAAVAVWWLSGWSERLTPWWTGAAGASRARTTPPQDAPPRRLTNRPTRFGRFATAGWVVGLALLVSPWGATTLAARPDRLEVWRNSWHLAWDYLVTGFGLGSFPMAYSSYALLVHVPHTFHAHNLFLDTWLELGLSGLVAFVWLMGAALLVASPSGPPTRHRDADRWRVGARLAVLVIAFHGLLDDAFQGYGGVGAILLFVPAALLARDNRVRGRSEPAATSWRQWPALVLTGALVAVALWPATRASWRANLGTLSQTRTELAVYRWPEWPVQDAVRRSAAIDLGPATVHYRAALAIDPANAVANRRLGQIALSVGDYEAARRYLEAAYRSRPGHAATRQMLGEALALAGEVAGAAALWRTLPLGQDRLASRAWWHASLGDDRAAQCIRQAIALTIAEDSRP